MAFQHGGLLAQAVKAHLNNLPKASSGDGKYY